MPPFYGATLARISAAAAAVAVVVPYKIRLSSRILILYFSRACRYLRSSTYMRELVIEQTSRMYDVSDWYATRSSWHCASQECCLRSKVLSHSQVMGVIIACWLFPFLSEIIRIYNTAGNDWSDMKSVDAIIPSRITFLLYMPNSSKTIIAVFKNDSSYRNRVAIVCYDKRSTTYLS